MWIAGFDMSTFNIDCVVIDVDGDLAPQWRRFVLDGSDAWERVRSVRQYVDGPTTWEDLGLYAAGVEIPFGPSANTIAMAVGALLTRLPGEILIERWAAGQWRKRLGLKGQGPKAVMKAQSKTESERRLAERWPEDAPRFELWPVDAHEAHLVACATLAAIEKTEVK